MHYLNLANSEVPPSAPNRAKKYALALVLLGVFACLGALLVLQNDNNTSSKYIVNLAYAGQEANQIISSTRKMSICSDQYDNEQEGLRNTCTEYTTSQDIVVTRVSQDLLSVYVIYSSVDERKTDSHGEGRTFDLEDMIDDEENGYDATIEELDLVFRATVSTQGTLLSLYSPNSDVADTLVRLTERLIEQTFPEINPDLYNNPYLLRRKASKRMRLLQSEEADYFPTQDTFLGEVAADYTYEVNDDGQVVLKKEYTDDDFVSFDYHLGGELPDIMYSSNTIVDSEGIVASNQETMHFNLTDPLGNDEDDVFDEVLGFLSVRVESSMEVHNVKSHDEELFEIIRKYEEADAFFPVDLESDGGFISLDKSADSSVEEIGEQEEFLLGASPQLSYTQEVSVFKKSVLSQNVEMKIAQANYEIYSDIGVAVYLNDQKLVTLYGLRINHPWLSCDSTDNDSGANFEKTYTVFEVQYPIMGIILIPIRASIRVDMGWSFKMRPTNEICNVLFNIYTKPALAAEGGLSVANVAQGGVSFSGSVANGYFNFNVYVNRLLFSAQLDINAQMIPFEYSIDLYYQYFSCNFQSILSRNLSLKSIVKKVTKVVKKVVEVVTKIVEICGMSDPHYVNLLKGQFGNTYSYSLNQEAFLLKIKS